MVYYLLEEATRGNIYTTTIKSNACRKYGCSTWESVVYSYSGQDKWEQLQKTKSKFFMNTKYNGRTFSLENSRVTTIAGG